MTKLEQYLSSQHYIIVWNWHRIQLLYISILIVLFCPVFCLQFMFEVRSNNLLKEGPMSEALLAKQHRILYQLTHNDSGEQRDIYFERTAQQGLRESISFLVLRQPFLPYMLESDATYKQATVVYQKLHHGKRIS